jgi:membrane protease subunit (stomatin/prohibitin family)
MAIIDRVKYDGPADTLVWRHPPDDLTWGTQVIVNQSQEVLFYKGGQALDVLGPGTHTLKTMNIPLLRRFIKAPFGGDTPFALDVKWGTKSPIPILDPKYNIFLPIRAFGQLGVRVADSRKFVVQLAGTQSKFTVNALNDYFRGIILTKAKDYIAETIIKKKINLLEISAYLDDLSTDLQKKMGKDFMAFGIQLVNFMLQSVNVPENDDTVKRLKKALSERAEIDILGGQNYKMKRTFDTMEGAAKNESGGGGMGAGMGLGMGLGAGAGMGGMMAGVMGSVASTQPQQMASCTNKKCNAQVPATSKFCPECGKPVVAATSKCPSCHHDVAAGAKFCMNCGKGLGSHSCPKCNAEVAPTAGFCGSCGKKLT